MPAKRRVAVSSFRSHPLALASLNCRVLQFVLHNLAHLIITQAAGKKTSVQKKTWRTLEPQLLRFVLSCLNRASLFSGIQTFIERCCFEPDLASSHLQLRHFESFVLFQKIMILPVFALKLGAP